MTHLGAARTVIAFDTPGFGMSDAVQGPETIESYAAALGDAIQAAGLAVHAVDVLGYHTGAAIAAQLALEQRLAVRRIVLAAVPVLDALQRASLGALPQIPFDEQGEWAREEWRRSWRWRGPGQSRDSILRGFAEKMRYGARERGAQAIVTFDMASALARLSQPLLILRPQDDLWEATARAMRLRPDVVAIELAELGHGMWDAEPERLAKIVSTFLD